MRRACAAFGDSTVAQAITLAPGARRARHRHRGRLARDARSSSRLAFPLDVRAERVAAETQFGHVFRPDPHQHQLGGGQVRDLRAPLRARRRAGLRRRAGQRLDLRPRRDPRPCATPTAGPPPRCGCRCCARRGSPTRTTDQGVHTLPLRPGARRGDRRRRPRGLPHQPARAPRTRRRRGRAAGDGGQRRGGRERGQARGRRERRCVVRVYESRGGRATARLRPDFPAAEVTATDLLERPLAGTAGPELVGTASWNSCLARSRWFNPSGWPLATDNSSTTEALGSRSASERRRQGLSRPTCEKGLLPR